MDRRGKESDVAAAEMLHNRFTHKLSENNGAQDDVEKRKKNKYAQHTECQYKNSVA